MGKTLTGGIEQEGTVNLLTGEQRNFLSQMLPQLSGAYQQYMQQVNPADYQEVFQQAVVDPSMMQYRQEVLPAIQQSFGDVNAGSSSALNQALAQSARDLTTSLGSQYGQFYQQGMQNQLSALGQLQGLASQRTFEPLLAQSQGLGGPLLGALGAVGGAYLGGPPGAALGAQAGNAVGSGFGGGYSRMSTMYPGFF